MTDINHYLDEALRRGNYPSDRQLSIALGVSATVVFHYRKHRQLPTDEVMLRLADLAGIARIQALMDVNSWRTKSDEARAMYQRLAQLVTLSALCLILLTPAPRPSRRTCREQIKPGAFRYIHYATFAPAKNVPF